MTDPGTPAPPQLSPDGQWRWDGQQWLPAAAPQAPIGSGYAPAVPGPTHDGLAITSLVLSVLWIFSLGSIAGVILGHLSRSKAGREGRQKSGVALAGLIVGYLGVGTLVFGLLAAVAIPVFLNQREKGDTAQVKLDLRNAAVFEETYFTEHDSYTTNLSESGGFTPTNGDSVVVVTASTTGYCLAATNRSGSVRYFLDSNNPVPSRQPCT